jgi:hypothetical protein
VILVNSREGWRGVVAKYAAADGDGNPFYATSGSFCIMCLSSISGTLVLNSIAHGWETPFIYPMSSNGAAGSRVSWKAQRIRTEFMKIDLQYSE